MKFIIDGYNLLHQGPWMKKGSGAQWLHNQRINLIDEIAKRIQLRDRKNSLVIFDAHAERSANTTDFVRHEMQILFAHRYPTADEMIDAILQVANASKDCAVVSSDRHVQRVARSHGCRSLSVEEWLESTRSVLNQDRSKKSMNPDNNQTAEPKPSVDSQDTESWIDYFNLHCDETVKKSPTKDLRLDIPEQRSQGDQIFPDGYADDIEEDF